MQVFTRSVMASACLVLCHAAQAQALVQDDLPVVVVSGEKMGKSLERTVTGASVATARDLEEHGDHSLTDMMARTPGVSTAPNNQTFSIRGVPVAGLGEQGANDLISVYVDGAVQPRQNVTLGTLSTWDMEQVEILRGPQSTVQGRNAMAGAIVLQSRNPTYTPSLRTQVRGGRFDERSAAFAGGGALVDGKLAARVAVERARDEGYIVNETLGKPANPRDSLTARAKLLWQPSPALDALFTVSHTDHRRGNPVVTQEDGAALLYRVRTNADAWDNMRQNSLVANLEYRLAPAWTLHSTSAVTHTRYDAVLDFDQTDTAPVDEVLRDHRHRLASQEFRLAYRADGLTGHLGVYAGNSHEMRDDRLLFDGEPVLGLGGDTRVRNRAVFGEVSWAFRPRWELIGGLRYDRERNRVAARFDSDPETVSPGSYHAMLPKLGVSHELGAGHWLGAQVQRGYRGGGSAFNIAQQASVPFDPEYSTNYELSYRGRPLGRRLQLHANAYWTDWKDQQVSVLTIPGNDNSAQVANAGRARLYGAELSATWIVSPAVRLYANGALNHTRYRSFQAVNQDLSGQAFERAPRRQLTVGGRWRPLPALSLHAELAYQSDAPSQYLTDGEPGSPRFRQVTGVLRGDAATLVNLNAQYEVGPWRWSAYVRNAGDRRYVVSRTTGPVVTAGAPRIAGIALHYEL
ncbi:TonB-dependent receptor [[Empedobacter] haloabium]|uniref:TonB-dependent receptor n=1 Tax=[Empedobacter] haloabium TaxID=592317 RepID=A0ABZ1UE16_9BURK